MVNDLNFQNLFSFCSQIKKMGIHKMLVRIANREYPIRLFQKQCVLGLDCVSSLFGRQLTFKILEYLPYIVL